MTKISIPKSTDEVLCTREDFDEAHGIIEGVKQIEKTTSAGVRRIVEIGLHIAKKLGVDLQNNSCRFDVILKAMQKSGTFQYMALAKHVESIAYVEDGPEGKGIGIIELLLSDEAMLDKIRSFLEKNKISSEQFEIIDFLYSRGSWWTSLDDISDGLSEFLKKNDLNQDQVAKILDELLQGGILLPPVEGKEKFYKLNPQGIQLVDQFHELIGDTSR